jgi:hypothetical protein
MYNNLYSLLAPVRKLPLFRFWYRYKDPKKSKKKIQKKFFLGPICTGPKTLFLDIKHFGKILELHLLPGTTFRNCFFKLR